jgi:hypothetical protein
MLKKINCIFTPEGIFDFSHPQFDTVGAKSDGSGVEGKKSSEQWHLGELNFFNGSCVITNFYNGINVKASKKWGFRFRFWKITNTLENFMNSLYPCLVTHVKV